MTERQWWVTSWGIEWVLADTLGKLPSYLKVPDPDSIPLPTTLKELDLYIPPDVSKRLELLRILEITANAYQDGVAELAANHLVAATVMIQPPSESLLQTFSTDLATLSKRLKANQQFKVAAALAGNIAKIIDQHV